VGRRIEQVGWLGWGGSCRGLAGFDTFSILRLVMAVGIYFISVHFA
jgi:hypothetical protein